MAGGRFKTQGNLCTRLVLGATRPGDLSRLPESDSLCRGLDRGQSCVLSRRPRRRPALSRPRPHAVRTAGRADVPRAGRGEDPPDGLGPALRSTCAHVLTMTSPNEEDTEARRSSGTPRSCSKLHSSEGAGPGSSLRPAACRAPLSNGHALAGSSLSGPATRGG